MKKLTALVKNPCEGFKVVEIGGNADSLKAVQALVGGGYIEHFYTDQTGLDWYCNDEGKLRNMQPNLWFGTDLVCGPIVCLRCDNECEWMSVTQRDVDRLQATFGDDDEDNDGV